MSIFKEHRRSLKDSKLMAIFGTVSVSRSICFEWTSKDKEALVFNVDGSAGTPVPAFIKLRMAFHSCGKRKMVLIK